MQRQAKSAIRDMVLDLRETLEAEIERELRRYGIDAERKWTSTDELNHLTEEEREEHRPRIEAAIARERDAGLDQAEAIEAYVREAAYTHMNRLLGLKCMETRGLIEETITTRPIYSDRSKRHRDYLDDHPDARRAPDRGLIPMLRDAYAEVSQHIGVVFDSDSDYTVVWPRHQVLKDCIDKINDLDDKVARKLEQDPDAVPSVYADDTFLGWVYQYFQEKEKDRVFRELRTKKKKIGGYDIVPATTIYTEHYMVQFLVENSLGALWMEMYPDSDLCDSWDYFVEDPNLQNEDGTRERGREPRPVAGLTLLDPACGSGHFLLYAFDLFAQMFEAEARMEGRAVDRAAIARRILRENLHGIDIDLRSIQLSALNLYMKACTYADLRLNQLQNGEPVQMNLVCADIVLGEGPELEELLARFENDSLTQELIETIWQGLQNARELGSLLKVEEQIDEVIARKREAEKGTFWEHPEDLWEQWKRDFLDTLKAYVDRAAEAFDVNRRMFGQEAIRGVQLLDLLTARYDLVTTNPPYMTGGNMSGSLKSYLRANYPDNWSDLFASFTERCLDFQTGGYVGMVVQQSLMFLRSYTSLRKDLLSTGLLRTVAHLGPGAFEEVSGEKVNTILLSFEDLSRDQPIATFLDIRDSTDKASALATACSQLQPSSGGPVYENRQNYFRAIEDSPLVYWLPSRLKQHLLSTPHLAEYAECGVGCQTSNTSRFTRYWWEVEPVQIGRGKKWTIFAMGGGFQEWFGNLNKVAIWADDGQEIKDYPKSYVKNQHLYYREGVYFNRVSSSGFCCRYLPENIVFSDAVAGVFPHSLSLFYLLGILNSQVASTLLGAINPTYNYQPGDVSRLPVPIPDESSIEQVSALAQRCVDLTRFLTSFDFTEVHFERSLIEASERKGRTPSVRDSVSEASTITEQYECRRLIYADLADLHVNKIYGLESRSTASGEDSSLPASSLPLLDEADPPMAFASREVETYVSELPRVTTADWARSYGRRSQGTGGLLPSEMLETAVTQLYVEQGCSTEEISRELGINPVSVVDLRGRLGLINPDDLQHEVENFLTHRIWELCKEDEDGIIPYAEGLRNPPLLDQVRGEIEAVFGGESAVSIEAEMDEILGRGGLAHWLENPFFKKHKSQFRRRPILWHITSRNKHFRVLVYYHKIDRDTLPKVRSQYLWPQLERARARLRAARAQDPPDVKTIGELEEIIADLEECNERLERVIQGDVDVDLPDWAVGPYRNGTAPYDPDLDDGVKVNILPLQAAELLPYKKVV